MTADAPSYLYSTGYRGYRRHRIVKRGRTRVHYLRGGEAIAAVLIRDQFIGGGEIARLVCAEAVRP